MVWDEKFGSLVNTVYKVSFDSPTSTSERLSVLDGWRGISILLVLAAHLLPLGPKAWRLNDLAGAAGMALFFTLSGFLITRLLLNNQHIGHFLIKRFLRIIPLAWVVMLLALISQNSSSSVYLSHFLFYANLPEIKLTVATSHFWSLCVEMQFYIGIAATWALQRDFLLGATMMTLKAFLA